MSRTLAQKIRILYNRNFNGTTHLMLREVLNAVAFLQVKTITEDYTISDDDKGKVLEVNADSPVTITIPEDVSLNNFFTVERIGSGTVAIVGSNVQVNDTVNGTAQILAQYTSAYVRAYAAAKVKIEGAISVS